MATSPAWTSSWLDIPLGAEESATRVIDYAAIDGFAHAIESYHPVHMDAAWARANSPYPDRVAHGVMTSALMSRPIMSFGERYRVRTVLVSTSAKYVRPVIAGDAITTTAKLVERVEEKKRLRFTVEARNQRGELVMVGEAIEQAV